MLPPMYQPASASSANDIELDIAAAIAHAKSPDVFVNFMCASPLNILKKSAKLICKK